jgi:hypothetical protein
MTALEKYDEADAGTVYRAETLKRMDATHRAYMDSWKVRLITSLWCSRESLLKLTA